MGQIPKIIYAGSGTKLTFNVDGKDVQLDKEAVEAMGAQSFDELVKSGALTERDKTSFMQTVGNFSNQAETGKYKLNTAGPNALISMKYEGPSTNESLGRTAEGNISERTAVGRFLSPRLKNDEASHMARLNSMLGVKIGAMALSQQDKEAKAADILKLKTESDAKKITDAETLRLSGKPEVFATYMNNKLGGTDNDAIIAAMSPEEKRRHAREYFEKVYPEVGKYGKLKGVDFSEVEKNKKADGTYDFSDDFLTNFYGRLFEDTGRSQMQQFLGNTPIQKETDAQTVLKKATEEADQNSFTSNPNYHSVGSDLVSRSPRINMGGLNYHAVITKDPKTGKQSLEYVSLPENVTHATPDALSTELKSAKRIQTTSGVNGEILLKMDGKLYHIPKIGENIKPRTAETFTGESPISSDIRDLVPSLKGVPLNSNNAVVSVKNHTRKQDPINTWLQSAIGLRADGGVISLQTGGIFENNIQKRLSEEDSYENTLNKPEPVVPSSPTAAGKVVNNVQGKSLSGKKTTGAPTIKDLYGAATGDSVELSDADKLDAGALASDFAGLVIGLTTGGVGGSVVSSGLGLASTIATAKADFMRDGSFDADDWLKTGLSVVADAATLFPYLGEGAQSLKIVKNLPKVAKLLKYAGYAGMGAGAVGLASKLESGEKSITDLNSDDLKLIIGGLRMASAGKSVGKTVKRQPVEEFEGRVINPEGKEIPATFTRTGTTFAPKDEALKDLKPVMEKSYLGLGKSRIAGSANTEVVVTPEETASSTFLGRKAMERRNTMRFGLNKEAKAKEITKLTTAYEKEVEAAKVLEKTPDIEFDKSKIKPGESIPTGNEKVPLPERTPALTREQSLEEASKSELSPKIQEILNRVSSPIPTTSTLDKVSIKVPRRSPGNKKEWEAAKVSEKETVKMHKETARGIKNKTIAPRHQDSTIESINKKYQKGGILFGAEGLVAPKKTYAMPYDPESNDLGGSTDVTKYTGPTRAIDPALNTNYMPNSMERLKLTKPGVYSQDVAQSQPSKFGLGNLKLKLNLNNKSALQMSETMRMMLLNKGIDARDTKVEAPMVTKPARVPMTVRGDMLTEAGFQQQANQIMGSAQPTSDATRNIAERAGLQQMAGQRIAQGVAADAQARQVSGQRSIENDLRNAEIDAQTATQNVRSLANKTQAERQGTNLQRDEKAANVNRLLASRNLEQKGEMDQKASTINQRRYRQHQESLDQDPKYRGLKKRYYDESNTTTGLTPATQTLWNEYQQKLDQGYNNIYGLQMNKSGGTLNKATSDYDMAMYKENKKDSREVAQISTRWNEKTSDKNRDVVVKASKDLTSFISKILSK